VNRVLFLLQSDQVPAGCLYLIDDDPRALAVNAVDAAVDDQQSNRRRHLMADRYFSLISGRPAALYRLVHAYRLDRMLSAERTQIEITGAQRVFDQIPDRYIQYRLQYAFRRR
jgi:hypothetical protein